MSTSLENAHRRLLSKRPNAYKRIRDLGENRVAQIDSMLLEGVSPRKIATLIQEDWNENTDIKLGTLARQLERYRIDKIDAPMALAVKRVGKSRYGRAAISTAEQNINVLDELAQLVKRQKRRINKIMAREDKMPTLIDSIRHEIKLLLDIYDGIAKLQLETGILQRAPKQFRGVLESSDSVRAWLRDFDVEVKTKEQLDNAVFDALSLLDDNTIEDADYEVVEDEEEGDET